MRVLRNAVTTFQRGVRHASNRGVVYMGPNKVEVQSIDYPKLELAEQKRKCNHGVILKVRGVVNSRCSASAATALTHSMCDQHGR